ncbi:phospholipase C delta 1, putative, partial [Eimeria acervulina]
VMRDLLVQPDVELYFDIFKHPMEAFISEEGYIRFLKEVQGVDTPEALQEELELFRNAEDSYKQTRPVVGRSAVGQYIDLLLCGCRCVELDCWDGADGPSTPLPSPGSLLCCFLIKSKVLNELGEFVEEGDEEDITMDALELQLARELEEENSAAAFLHANENGSEGSDPRASSLPQKSCSSLTAAAAAAAAAATAAGAPGGAAEAAAAPAAAPPHAVATAATGNPNSCPDATTDAKADRAAAKLEKLKAFQRNICLRGKKLKGFEQPRNRKYKKI